MQKYVNALGAALAVAAVALPLSLPAVAQAPAGAAGEAQGEEIVVTARRTGLPVWRVSSPTTTLVLVGAIDGVIRDTRWDPAPLADALLKADRVMFPSSMHLTESSPFALIGYFAKWRKQATLPKGQTLAAMMAPDQFARLARLEKRGILKRGFERKHPFHLATTLREIAKGKSEYGPDAGRYVMQTVKKHKLKLVPIERSKLKPVAQDFFASRPETHVPCLLDAVALVEAGPGVVKARSDAWAERRVPEVLNSPAEKVYHSCWPAEEKRARGRDDGLRRTVRRLLTEPQVTLAVVSLDSLGGRDGVLDDLQAAGFDVRGPRWK